MQARTRRIAPSERRADLHDSLSGAVVPRAVRLADGAYDRIKTMLLEGNLQPGERLSVLELGRTLECSRVPVMEAMKRLESDGLVEIVPQVGCHVVIPEQADVADFFELFAVSEALVARFAADRRTEADSGQFRQVCMEIEHRLKTGGRPADRDPVHRHLNLLFHTQIHRMARAPEPSRIAAGLWDRSDFYIRVAFGSLYISRTVRLAHRVIREAILAGDGNAAETATRAHLRAVGAAVTAQLGNASDSARRGR
jgi:DNA-binding GntR family transcriptional regulator